MGPSLPSSKYLDAITSKNSWPPQISVSMTMVSVSVMQSPNTPSGRRFDLTPRSKPAGRYLSFILETLQSKSLLALHLFQTQLDEVPSLLHLRDYDVLEGIDPTFGCFYLDE